MEYRKCRSEDVGRTQLVYRGWMYIELETTPRFQTTIEAAKREASRFGHGYVGVEHIVLAITNDPNSVAAVALSQSTSLARASST